MKNKIFALILFMNGCSFTSIGQTLLNGDFEINTALVDKINLTNSAYDSYMSNSAGFGSLFGGGPGGGDLDIITSASYCDPAQNGSWFVALTSGGTDAFSLTLSSPLVVGNSYNLSFYDRSCSGWADGSPVKIGVSNSNNNFGTLIYTAPAPIVDSGWTQRTFAFIAPLSANYITVTCDGIVSGGPWTQVDNFVLDATSSIPSVDQNNNFQIYPNPASNQLNIQSFQNTNSKFNIFNSIGQLVKSGVVEKNSTVVQINNLANGVYYIELSTSGNTVHKRFIIEK